MPFEIPDGWRWCTLDDFAYVAAGSTPNKDAFVDEGIPYIKMYNLRNQKIDFDFHPQYIKEDVHNGKLQRSRTEVGDLIMNIVGPPLGKLAFIPESLPQSNFNQAAVLIRPYIEKNTINRWLFYYLSEMSEINSISTKGSAGQVNISLTQSQNMRVPMPPLAEQIRIVNKLDSLWNITEGIESGIKDVNCVINKFKSKILDLAIHGKLVPQDASDEPASELLKRINPKAVASCDNPQYGKVPSSWVISTIGEVFTINPKTHVEDDTEAAFVPMTCVSDGYSNTFEYECRKWGDIKKGFVHFQENDVAVAKISPCLENRKSVVFHDLPNGIGAGTTELNVFRCVEILPEYALFYFKSEMFIGSCAGTYNGVVGQQRVAKSFIQELPIGIPPYKEQLRIVSKVNNLFSQLDMIEKIPASISLQG